MSLPGWWMSILLNAPSPYYYFIYTLIKIIINYGNSYIHGSYDPGWLIPLFPLINDLNISQIILIE